MISRFSFIVATADRSDGTGEDTEPIVSLIKSGVRGRLLQNSLIAYARKPYDSDERAWRYSAESGRAMAKHRLRTQFLSLLLFDLIRIPFRYLREDPGRGSRLWSHAAGMA